VKGYASLAAVLADHGVSTMFGVMGDGNMYFVDSFVRAYGGEYVAAANEAGATLMAAGYAAGSGRVGVATVTHGPGRGSPRQCAEDRSGLAGGADWCGVRVRGDGSFGPR
jgi:thiamine pyrophosphate-dependent acetolactate synthase large subunit-like protein